MGTLQKPSRFRRETRLGVVLYGGVSLAIYLNGVSQEFYNAVRGRGIYKLIKALTDSDIVVDIVSGTSAGGINGILLSYAIANSNKTQAVDFDVFANIWRESGDINKLMWDVKDNKQVKDNNQKKATTIESIFNDNYYEGQFVEAFQEAARERETINTEDEWYSEVKELDLFITGTDVLGRVYKTLDNTGKVIEVKNHRAVFHLKHRKDQKQTSDILYDEKDTVKTEALATLCRITSCFPVAFPVVTVKLDPEDNVRDTDKKEKKEKRIDKKIEIWGNLLRNRILPEERPKEGYQVHFIDGGVLDNRPFSYTIDAIYYRTTDRKVNRQLFFLDPNPETFIDSPKFQEMKRPNMWEVIRDSLISLPSYESIGADLTIINERNQKIRNYQLLYSDVKSNYIDNNRKSSRSHGEKNSQNADTRQENLYLRCRFMGLINEILPLLFEKPYIKDDEKKQKRLEKAAILKQFLNEQKDGDSFQQICKQIENLDVSYAIRKHYFLLSEIIEELDERHSEDGMKYEDCLDLTNQISWQVELLKVIGESVQEMLTSEQVCEEFYTILDGLDDQQRDANQKKVYNYLLNLFRLILDVENYFNLQGNSSSNSAKTDGTKELKDYIVNLVSREIPTEEEKNKKGEEIFDQLTGRIKRQLREKINTPSFTDKSGEENKIDKSILQIINDISVRLIQESNLDKKRQEKFTKLFQNYQEFDQDIYPYLFSANIQGQDIINLVRFSPTDANLGLGKYKTIDEKIEGHQWRGFGGFLKKSWRSNDILWGRLDGLNRMVDSLLTLDSVETFSDFVERGIQKPQNYTFDNSDKDSDKYKFIDKLINESFPELTDEESQKRIKMVKESLSAHSPSGHDPVNNHYPGLTDEEIQEIIEMGKESLYQEIIKMGKKSLYIDKLLNESFPELTDEESQETIEEVREYLQELVGRTQNLNEEEKSKKLEKFKENIVTLGHRQILKENLEKVLEDSISQELEWNYQNTQVTKQLTIYLNSLESKKNGTYETDNQQLKNLERLSNLLNNINTSLEGPIITKIPWWPSRQDFSRKYIEPKVIIENCFTSLSTSKQKHLGEYINELNIHEYTDNFYFLGLLNQLLLLVKEEKEKMRKKKKEEKDQGEKENIENIEKKLGDIQKKIEKISKTIKSQLIPKWKSNQYYYDKLITPLVVAKIAKTRLDEIQEEEQEKDSFQDYFDEKYQVSSETIKNDIPAGIKTKLLSRSASVFRHIINQSPTRDFLKKIPFPLFSLLNFIFPFIVWWIDNKNPPLRLYVVLLIVILPITYILSKLPEFILALLLVILIEFLIIFVIWRKFK